MPLVARVNVLASWVSAANVLLARTYVLLISSLLFWAAAPTLLGWQSTVILTGSMSPALAPGDVVSVQEIEPARVRTGQVVVVTDPSNPSRTLAHRVQERNSDGSLVLRGDANRSVDPTPAHPADVRGLARVNIPAVGLPRVWLHERRYVELLALAVVTAIALTVTTRDAHNLRAARAATPPEPAPVHDAVPRHVHAASAGPAVPNRTVLPQQRSRRTFALP